MPTSTRTNIFCGTILLVAVSGFSQPRPPDSRDGSSRSGKSAATNEVSIRISGAYRLITANGIPDHPPGQFPNRGNPHQIYPQRYSFRVSMKPKVNERASPSSLGVTFGIALNGVPFNPSAAEFWRGDRNWQYEAKDGAINLGLDEHNAHVQPGGEYHYHAMPMGLARKLYQEDSIVLVGYAADGFPIYARFGFEDPMDLKSGNKILRSSYQLKKGERPNGPDGKFDGRYVQDYEYVKGSGDLDECNGRFGVTPEYPKGIYHYYITDSFPFLSRSFRGTPDASFGRRGGPGGTGGRRPQLRNRTGGGRPPSKGGRPR
jgi:hypothetical protein